MSRNGEQTMIKHSDFLIKADSPHGEIEGYASVFNNIDRHGHIIKRGAYSDGLPLFLSDNFIGGSGHDWANPVGKFYAASEDGNGLYVKGRFSDTAAARDLRTLVQDGVIKKLSVGIEVETVYKASHREVADLWASEGYQPSQDDRKRLDRHKSILIIEKAQLLEVSPVAVPANDRAAITGFKSAGLPGSVEAYLSRIANMCKSYDDDDPRLESIRWAVNRLAAQLEPVSGEPDPEPVDATIVKAQVAAAMELLGIQGGGK